MGALEVDSNMPLVHLYYSPQAATVILAHTSMYHFSTQTTLSNIPDTTLL